MSSIITPNPVEPPLPGDHAQLVVSKFLQGRVVPFLGAGVNLCDRPPGLKWTSSEQTFAPNGAELAAELADKFKYVKPESICTAPEALCLRRQPELDLARISQYGDLNEGQGELYDRLRALFTRKYPPTSLHKFLASIPAVEPESGRPENRNLLIVTTNYDDLMERALEEVGPLDVVFYDPDAKPARFWHRKPDGTTTKIDDPNNYDYSFFDTQPAVLKIHGTIDRASQHEGYVITEDHYIEYLAEEPLEKMLPNDFLTKLRSNHLLFLGYSLRDWNLRVFLRRLKRNARQAYKAWAVMPYVDAIEEQFWYRQQVGIIKVMLKSYRDALKLEVAAQGIQLKGKRSGDSGGG